MSDISIHCVMDHQVDHGPCPHSGSVSSLENHDCTRYNGQLIGDTLVDIIGFLEDNPGVFLLL